MTQQHPKQIKTLYSAPILERPFSGAIIERRTDANAIYAVIDQAMDTSGRLFYRTSAGWIAADYCEAVEE